MLFPLRLSKQGSGFRLQANLIQATFVVFLDQGQQQTGLIFFRDVSHQDTGEDFNVTEQLFVPVNRFLVEANVLANKGLEYFGHQFVELVHELLRIVFRFEVACEIVTQEYLTEVRKPA